MRADQGRTVSFLVATLLATLACGRTPITGVVEKDAGEASPDSVLGTGGAPGTGRKSNSGGTGGLGGIPHLGTEIPDWHASTGEAAGSCQTLSWLPEDAVPVCTFTGSQGVSSGCEDVPVRVLVDSTSFYFQLEWNRSVVRCPMGTSNSRIFEKDSYGESSGIYGFLYGQMLANGLVRFECVVQDSSGPGWSYRYTCSTSGIQTIQPNPKSRAIYIHIPGATRESGGPLYEGCLSASCEPGCAPSSTSFYLLGDEAQTPMWTSPVNFSADCRTLWFNDRDGGRIAMRINESLEVLEIRR
jgi:hypothetical protein